MTDISAFPTRQQVVDDAAPRAARSGRWALSLLRAGLCVLVLASWVTPDREIAAKAFKFTMIAKNIRYRVLAGGMP